MTLLEVMSVIEQENEFGRYCSGRYPHKQPVSLDEHEKPLELWLLWMEAYLNDAKKAATNEFDYKKALDKLRAVLSLGVRAAMQHGLPKGREVVHYHSKD